MKAIEYTTEIPAGGHWSLRLRKGTLMRLTDVEGGTELTYDVDAQIGGKLAQLGSRLITGFARKMADQFFERFQAEVEGTGNTDTAG